MGFYASFLNCDMYSLVLATLGYFPLKFNKAYSVVNSLCSAGITTL